MNPAKLIAWIAALSFATSAAEIDVIASKDGAITYSVFVDTYAVRNGLPSMLIGARSIETPTRERVMFAVDGCIQGYGIATEYPEGGQVRRRYWSESGDRILDYLAVAVCVAHDEATKRRAPAPRQAPLPRAPQTLTF